MPAQLPPLVRSRRPAPGLTWVDTADDVDPDARSARLRERLTGRWCASVALAHAGVAAGPLPADDDGLPVWPDGYVGSLTHCPGYRAAVVGHRSRWVAVGVDAEPHAALPEGVADVVLTGGEQCGWAALPGVHRDRLAFSAKEAAYKTVFATAREPLDFLDVRVRLDADGFTARIATRRPRTVRGSWSVRDGFVLTWVAVPA